MPLPTFRSDDFVSFICSTGSVIGFLSLIFSVLILSSLIFLETSATFSSIFFACFFILFFFTDKNACGVGISLSKLISVDFVFLVLLSGLRITDSISLPSFFIQKAGLNPLAPICLL